MAAVARKVLLRGKQQGGDEPAPLPPLPQRTATVPGRKRTSTSSASRAPAFSIIWISSRPNSSTATRSTSRICSAVTAGVDDAGMDGSPRASPLGSEGLAWRLVDEQDGFGHRGQIRTDDIRWL